MKSLRGCLAAFLLGLSAFPAPADEEGALFQFINTDVRDVMAVYERFTGIKVEPNPQLAGTICAFSSQRIPKAKATELLEEALFANGYALFEPKPGVVHILGPGQNVATQPIPRFTKLSDLPASERVVSYVCKVKRRDLKQLATVLQVSVATTPVGIPSIVADEKAGALVITDRTSSLRHLIQLVEALDR